MDYETYKDSLIKTARKRAEQFLATGKLEGDFAYAIDRHMENEGYIKLAALVLTKASPEEIRQALYDSMFSDLFMEKECDRIESCRIESEADARRYDEGR